MSAYAELRKTIDTFRDFVTASWTLRDCLDDLTAQEKPHKSNVLPVEIWAAVTHWANCNSLIWTRVECKSVTKAINRYGGPPGRWWTVQVRAAIYDLSEPFLPMDEIAPALGEIKRLRNEAHIRHLQLDAEMRAAHDRAIKARRPYAEDPDCRAIDDRICLLLEEVERKTLKAVDNHVGRNFAARVRNYALNKRRAVEYDRKTAALESWLSTLLVLESAGAIPKEGLAGNRGPGRVTEYDAAEDARIHRDWKESCQSLKEFAQAIGKDHNEVELAVKRHGQNERRRKKQAQNIPVKPNLN